MPKTFRKLERACARLEGMRTATMCALMLRDASQRSRVCGRIYARSHASRVYPTCAFLKRPISGKPEIGCDAPQHEGAARFGRTKPGVRARRRSRETNLRVWSNRLLLFWIVINNENRNSSV